MLSRLYNYLYGSVKTEPKKPTSENLPQVEKYNQQTAIIQKAVSSIIKVDQDQLSDLLIQLQTMAKNFQDEKQKWEMHKQKLPKMEKAASLVLSTDKNLKVLLNEFLMKLKSLLQTADHNLEDLLLAYRPKIHALCTDLHSIYEQMNHDHLPTEERLSLQCRLCDDCITLLNAIVGFISEVEDEINLCLKLEALGEEIALNLARFTISLLTDLPMPKLDFNIAAFYRKYLFHEIQPEAKQINRLLLNTQEEVAQAEKVFTRSNSFFSNPVQIAAEVDVQHEIKLNI